LLRRCLSKRAGDLVLRAEVERICGRHHEGSGEIIDDRVQRIYQRPEAREWGVRTFTAVDSIVYVGLGCDGLSP